MSGRVSRDARGDWYCSVAVEGDFSRPRQADKVVGIDLGIKSAITLSDGRQFDAPKPLKAYGEKLARLQRVVARRKRGSNRRQKAVRAVGRLHVRIANIRSDWTHKATTDICKNHAAIGIEDLAVKNMTRNHSLARALSDVSLGEVRRQITYKSETFGVDLHVHDRFYPSSQLCSSCGSRQKMPLSVREYACGACGVVEDRDVNAAKNLLPPARREVARGQKSSGSPVTVGETGLVEARTEARSNK
jgi:putative transposase